MLDFTSTLIERWYAYTTTNVVELEQDDYLCKYKDYTWVMPGWVFDDMFNFNLWNAVHSDNRGILGSLMSYDGDVEGSSVECNGFPISSLTTLEARNLAIALEASFFEKPKYEDGAPVRFHDHVEVNGLAMGSSVDSITFFDDGTFEIHGDGNTLAADGNSLIRKYDPDDCDILDDVITSMSMYLDSDGKLDVAKWVEALSKYREGRGW